MNETKKRDQTNVQLKIHEHKHQFRHMIRSLPVINISVGRHGGKGAPEKTLVHFQQIFPFITSFQTNTAIRSAERVYAAVIVAHSYRTVNIE